MRQARLARHFPVLCLWGGDLRHARPTMGVAGIAVAAAAAAAVVVTAAAVHA